MAKRRLVIGAHTAGIGDAVIERSKLLWGGETDTVAPTRAQLDLDESSSVWAYLAINGPFDEIVYSAGISKLQWITDITNHTDVSDVMGINATGAVLIAAAHSNMFPDHAVRYAVVVSDASDTPMRGSIAYCMSKAALEMAVRVMARELAPLWTVVAVSPGVVDDTGMTNQLAKLIPEFRGWTPEAARAYEDKGSVLGRRVTKQEVADTILFALTGPVALNGSTITINGGK